MFVECVFNPVRKNLCPPDPNLDGKCIIPLTKDELCEADPPFPTGTEDINNCEPVNGDYDVYTTDCGGNNLVINPRVT